MRKELNLMAPSNPHGQQVVVTGSDVAVLDVKSKTPITDQLRRELEAQKAKLVAELKPFRDLYDAHVNNPQYLEAKRKIKEINLKLGPIENELAALARARGAKGIKLEPGTYAAKM
jgi:hypothetical protein